MKKLMLIASHAAHISGDVPLRSADTDVFVILAGALGEQRSDIWSTSKVIIECGMGKDQSYICVISIVNNLKKTPGLTVH